MPLLPFLSTTSVTVKTLSDDSVYQITEIEQAMRRASRASFYRHQDAGDAVALPVRSGVVFVHNGVVWFAGRTLPAQRSIRAGQDVVQYVAADYLEYLGMQPCDEVNEWYNRTLTDTSVYPYPTGQTVREIIETEFASIVGALKPIGSLNFDELGDIGDIVIYDFQTTGKSFLGLLDALCNEVPMMAYWYDPSTIPVETPQKLNGGTLRFYNLATESADIAHLILNPKGAGAFDVAAPTVNCESVDIQEDISASYDEVTLVGWGDMSEQYELASPAWTEGSPGQDFEILMRDNPATGRPEAFPVIYGHPWSPESTRENHRYMNRRYSVEHDIVDLKLTLKEGADPPEWIRQEQSMHVEVLAYTWYAGPIGFIDADGQAQNGYIDDNVKVVPYTGGFVDDFGSVEPNHTLYPDYPGEPLTPRFSIGVPAAFERNYFLLANALVRRTGYRFTANLSGDTDFDDVVGINTYKYWQTGDEVWMYYTALDTLEVSVSNLALGYAKTLRIYDQRFLKYTNLDDEVLRDDTALMTVHAQAIFDLVSRPRHYGNAMVHLDPDNLDTFGMGFTVDVTNWRTNGNVYEPNVRIQGRTLTQLRDEWRLKITFDNAVTYVPLERTLKAREFWKGNKEEGSGGLQGKRGDTLVVPDGNGKKPAKGIADLTDNAVDNTSTETTTPLAQVLRGKIAVVTNTADDTPNNLTYQFTANFNGVDYASLSAEYPLLRPYTDAFLVRPAAEGSDCLVFLFPNADNSGYYGRLAFCDEKLIGEECESNIQAIYDPDGGTGGELSMDAIIIGDDGHAVSDKDGNVVIGTSSYDEWVDHPEDYIAVGADGDIVFDKDGNAVHTLDPDAVVEETYFDILVASATGGSLSTIAGNIVTTERE